MEGFRVIIKSSMLIISLLVSYRIFTLDHTFRPNEEMIHISVYVSRNIFFWNKEDFERSADIIHVFLILWQNTAGNRIMKYLKTAKGGIFKGLFPIPDVSEYVITDLQ